ncbi:MAG: hypothetical protein WCF18_12155 [Chthoniobacteraceae bacterium]
MFETGSNQQAQLQSRATGFSPSSSVVAEETLPPGVLSLEVKFLCGECDTKLIIDARWQGRRLNCPQCGAPVVVPECLGIVRAIDETVGGTEVGARTPGASPLTAAEINFLSGHAEEFGRVDCAP